MKNKFDQLLKFGTRKTFVCRKEGSRPSSPHFRKEKCLLTVVSPIPGLINRFLPQVSWLCKHYRQDSVTLSNCGPLTIPRLYQERSTSVSVSPFPSLPILTHRLQWSLSTRFRGTFFFIPTSESSRKKNQEERLSFPRTPYFTPTSLSLRPRSINPIKSYIIPELRQVSFTLQ